MAAYIEDGIRRTVRQEHVGRAQELNQDDVGHEAEHMMQRQEGQRFPAVVFRMDYTAVPLVNVQGGKRLLADGFTGIGEDPAAAGGSAGAHGHILAPDGGEPDGAGSVHDRLEVQLADIAGQAARLLGDDDLAPGLIQQALDLRIRRGRIEQQHVVPGTEDAPEKGGPVTAGIHRDGDPAGVRRQGAQEGGKVIRPAAHFGIGHGKLFLALQPVGSRRIAVFPDDVKECSKRFVSRDPRADAQGIRIAHGFLLSDFD